MKKVVQEINASTPTIVDEYTRLDSVALTGKTKFEYYYTVKGVDTSIDDFDPIRNTLKSASISNLKGNSDMKAFRENDITMGFNYYNEQAELLFDFIVTPTDYK